MQKSEGGFSPGSVQISQVLLEEGEEGGQVMFVGVRMSETVTFARINLNTIILVTIFSGYKTDTFWAWLSENCLDPQLCRMI